MAALIQIPINFSAVNTPRGLKPLKRGSFCTVSSVKIDSFYPNKGKFGAFRDESSFWEVSWEGRRSEKKRVVLVRFNSLDGGDGGGGGRDNSETVRVLGNIALAIVFTYLTFTGQLGWVLDAIVSVWLLVVLLPIIGIVAFFWWAGQDIVQGACPNCGNDFQIFKSAVNDDIQLCPFCSQPFSVVGDEFVRDPVRFSNESRTFGQAFKDFTSRSKKDKKSSVAVVDVEAEIKDAE
ncbi:PREDICTED: uncharacterized protein LOC109178166 isoform X2 [Ipomoea nil]|uniref:uncharacterized protein LOC109178166 isoform X2 n=1 Tax=Ipomoea nil TaxID=35883 RepID=UPI00090190F9|nr:PREDICTED: uncharacterized protein LOC109178166 isoform X2 [Ipomoea nil]